MFHKLNGACQSLRLPQSLTAFLLGCGSYFCNTSCKNIHVNRFFFLNAVSAAIIASAIIASAIKNKFMHRQGTLPLSIDLLTLE